MRTERDTFGIVSVPENHLWGAETERSLHYFPRTDERFPSPLIHALCYVKKAAAEVNAKMKLLDPKKAEAICAAIDEILSGKWNDEFPLSIWQTGSGTQTHMNVNEVIANRASELLGGKRGTERLIDAHDDVNRSQSTNDAFSTAMNIAASMEIHQHLIPAVILLKTELRNKSAEFKKVVKIGRTHLMDATPLTLGQEFSGYVTQLEYSLLHIFRALPHLYELAIGGTAVGTGLNAPPEFAEQTAKRISELTDLPFTPAKNKFEAMAAHDALVQAHGNLKGLASSLFKIANDIRWLASGPRCAIGEIRLPENEPGSSIMPGKVNPTQCEAMAMVCLQVMGNDATMGFAGASGNFELNTFKPLLIYNFLQSVRLLSQQCMSFSTYCVSGIQTNDTSIRTHLENSLMLATALTPHLGYENTAKIAKKAHQEGLTLKQAALNLGLVSSDDFDRWVKPSQMI